MGLFHEAAMNSIGGGKNLLPIAGGGLALAAGTIKTAKAKPIRWVPQEHTAIRVRHGKATRDGTVEGEMYSDLVQPGLRGSLMFWRSLMIVSHQVHTADIQGLELDTTDKKQIKVDASILWSVPREKRAALKAYFATEGGIGGTEDRLRHVGRSALNQVMGQKSLVEIRDTEIISAEIEKVCAQPFTDCGVQWQGLLLEVSTQTPSDRLADALRQIHIPTAETIAEEIIAQQAGPLHAVPPEASAS